MTLASAIEDFVNNPKYYRGFSETTVKNLIYGKDNDSVFWEELGDKLSQNSITNDEFTYCVKMAVLAKTKDKQSAIEIFNALQKHLNNKLHTKLFVEFPPIDISNTFERLMFIAKYLQMPENTISSLKDVLWVGERTIEDDMKRLRGGDDPIKINGRTFTILDTTRRNDHMQFASTAHPMFLAPNLIQAITVLRGLKKMSCDPKYKDYAVSVASEIWSQLSDYANNRIRYVFSELLPEEMDWFDALNARRDDYFSTEESCSVSDVFLDALKNGKKCCVEYSDGHKNRILKDVFIKTTGEGYELQSKDKEPITVKYENIIRTAYFVEGLL